MSRMVARFAVGLAVVAAVGGGMAAPAGAGGPAPRAATLFTGLGASRKPAQALQQARTDARDQATAAGFSDCTTVSEDVHLDPQPDAPHNYIAEVTISCTA